MAAGLVAARRGPTRRRRRSNARRLAACTTGDRRRARYPGGTAGATSGTSDLPRCAAACHDSHTLGADGVAGTQHDPTTRRTLDPAEPLVFRSLVTIAVAACRPLAAVAFQRLLFARGLVAVLPILGLVARFVFVTLRRLLVARGLFAVVAILGLVARLVATAPPGVFVARQRVARARRRLAALARLIPDTTLE